MRGQWPSGWEDPEDENLDVAEPDEETSVRLAEVAAFLAAVPDPVLPGAIEARIAAALAVESAASAEKPPVPSAEPDAPRILRERPARPRVGHPGRARRFERVRPALVAGPLVAVLLFAGLGYAISRAPSSSSSSGPAVAAVPSSTVQYAGSAGGSRTAAGSNGSPVSTSVIVVTRSGTNYLAGTLAAQVSTTFRMDVAGKVPHPAASSSSAAASVTSAPASSEAASSVPAASASASAPVRSAQPATGVLSGCVLQLTGGVIPRLVDRASYEGTPAYVIATTSHVWVVGLDCTKARPHVIAQASLAS